MSVPIKILKQMKEFLEERVSDLKYSVLDTQELGNFTIYSISHRMQNYVIIYQYYEIRTKRRRVLSYMRRIVIIIR